MPELPEVEVISQGLAPHLTGRSFTDISFSHKRLRLPLPPATLCEQICDTPITGVRRRAKYVTIETARGALLVIHLGMTGNLGIFPRERQGARHDHGRFTLDNGMELRYNDTRRFGSIQIFANQEEAESQLFRTMGVEPFSPKFSPGYLQDRGARRQKPVKNFLMDGHIVVGIGNIYANEILFACGIHPARPVKEISYEEWEKIIKESRQTLKRAIAAGGSTISDFVNSSGEKGYFQLSLQVYGRKDQACPKCGSQIVKETMAGRASFYCPRCQR